MTSLKLSSLVAPIGHLLVLACLVLVPAFWLAPPLVWNLPPSRLGVLGSFLLAYLVVLALQRVVPRIAGGSGVLGAFWIGIAVFGSLMSVLLLAIWPPAGTVVEPYPREALLASFAIGVGGIILLSSARAGSWLKLVVPGLVALGGLAGQAAYYTRLLPRDVPPASTTRVVHTPLYSLRLTIHERWVPDHWRKGGGLTTWNDGYLLATGNGELLVIAEHPDGKGLDVTKLPHSVPLNADEFVAGARDVFRDSAKKTVESARFRVADVLALEYGDSMRLLVSHHYWHVDRQCVVLRVSELVGTHAAFLQGDAGLEWRTLFESVPCLSLNTNHPRGSRFDGLENGGRMARLDESALLLTVGDHSFDGVNRPEQLAQDPDATYGKIMKIVLATGEASVFSSGHRNPQGIYVDAGGTIWSTEHGPQGGDEINVIRNGLNYGWPRVTYGTDYSRHSWPLNPSQGRHEGFEKPVFATTPSMGIGSLTAAGGDKFPLWEGDLLVATLKGQTLWRMRMEAGRLIFAESIVIGTRIRDIMMAHDGRVVLWTDDSEIIFIEPTAATGGDALLGQCTACHGINPWDISTSLGPNLYAIVGRKVAAREDFRYSEALQDLGGRWTRDRLDAFLADPQSFAPGTTMPFPGIADSKERALLIDFLESVPENP